jgi:hypothetical protein
MKHDDETHAPISGSEPTQPPSTDDVHEKKGFRDPLGEDAVEHLRRYQVITVPPSARRALLSAQLPGASPELLYDTLPPNLGVQHDHAEVPEEIGTSVTVSPARQRRLRAIVIGLAALMVVLVAVALLRRPSAEPSAAGNPAPGQATAAAVATPAPTGAPVPPAPPDSQVSASVSAASDAPIQAARTESDSTHRKSATEFTARPSKEPSVAVSPPTRSSPAPDPATVPPATPEGTAGKKFRLGSR